MRIDDSSIRVNRHTCIACGICVDRCIMDNLRLSVAPCRQACPVNLNCQGHVRLLAMGREELALAQVLPFGPLLALIASTCSAPCERACTRKKTDGAVHILGLERYLARKYANELNTIAVPKDLSGKHIAIVGAGIYGLACGLRALQSGHAVAIYPGSRDHDSSPIDPGQIKASLERAGAVFPSDTGSEEALVDPQTFDAVVLSRIQDRLLLPPGHIKTPPDARIDAISHLIQDNIFCADIGESGNGPVFEIAEAFETIESVNRFLNNEPFGWGRGFYTQDGAVKSYRVDKRVGSDEQRALEEKLVQGFDEETAKQQASRCFGCGRAFEKNQTCWYCLPCELECPQGALDVKIPYLVR